MIDSRSLDDLLPEAKEKALQLIKVCTDFGITLIITSTYRDNECQNKLYAQGRTAPGKIVTNAKAGESYHNYRIAFDVVPLRNGKPIWDSADQVWRQIGKLGEECGLEWAGRWTGKIKETAHFQLPGYNLADLKSGLLARPLSTK
jgi:peptidoglycan L-alanyl-D-glutamate endopeptidase CwlK